MEEVNIQKNYIVKILDVGIILLFIGASIFPIVNANQMQNRKYKEKFKDNSPISILNPPRPSPIKFGVDFNITFYQPSSITIKRHIFQVFPYSWYTGSFSVIDFSNSPVGKIEYIEQSTGSETAKTFNFFMVGFFWAKIASDSHYNESTGLGYITGSAIFLFYFGL